MALRLLADENFDGRITAGLLQRHPDLDLARIQDVGLSGADDPSILAWAAGEGRILLTHDRRTVPVHAAARIEHGEEMPGVIVVSTTGTLKSVLDSLTLLIEASFPNEWDGCILTVP